MDTEETAVMERAEATMQLSNGYSCRREMHGLLFLSITKSYLVEITFKGDYFPHGFRF